MRKLLPVVLLVLLVGVFFKPFFLNGQLPVPSDTIVGLYNPFRDFYATSFPRGIPFKNFLITDPVRQQYPWRKLVIEEEKNLQFPLWNPYTFAGSPLLANFQSAALYPLNVLFFLLPFSFAWSFLIFLQPLLGALFMYFYLRNLKLHTASCLLGAISFAFCGFAVSWSEWNTLFHVLLWVPLVLLAKDKLLEKWNIWWTIVFFFAETAAFFAGHIQTLFYALLITNTYLFLKVYEKAKKQKGIVPSYIKIYAPFLFVGLAMYAVTSFQWYPALQFILQSARDVDVQPFQNTGWFLPWQHLVQFLVPDFFGNPTTLNYWGVWNYAELVGYIGIIPLIFSLVAIFSRRDKKTYFWTGFLFVAFFFALPTPLAKIPFILNIPFLSTAQPTRLIAIIDFSLVVLAALGIDTAIKNKRLLLPPIIFVSTIFIGIWAYVLYFFRFTFPVSLENISVAKHNLIFPTIIFAISVTVFILWNFTEKMSKKNYTVLFTTIIIIIATFDLFRFGQKFLPFTPKEYLYPQTKVLQYLQQHSGINRVMETDPKILPPNFSVMYHIQSVDGYDPLYLLRYGEFISALIRNKPDIDSPFGFNRIITPQTYTSPFINLLGVKYVLCLTDIISPQFTKVLQEGETRVYENKNVLPRAFFIHTLFSVANKQQVITQMFDTAFDFSKDAVVEQQVPPTSYSSGSVVLISYTANQIVLYTKNNGEGFLVLTDAFYPTWHAFVDGKETKILVTDFAFRGIVVPQGNHTIIFKDSLF